MLNIHVADVKSVLGVKLVVQGVLCLREKHAFPERSGIRVLRRVPYRIESSHKLGMETQKQRLLTDLF